MTSTKPQWLCVYLFISMDAENFYFKKQPLLFLFHRRNEPGDRDKALVVIKRVAEMKGGNAVQDVVCLCGRIYKDKFNESNYKDTLSRDEAIKW